MTQLWPTLLNMKKKTQKAKTQPKTKEAKAPKAPCCSSQQPGTSRTTPAAASINSETDDDDDGDDEKCCACSLFQPAELANHVSLTLVKWAQCDEKMGGLVFIGPISPTAHLLESLGGETNSCALIANPMRSNYTPFPNYEINCENMH